MAERKAVYGDIYPTRKNPAVRQMVPADIGIGGVGPRQMVPEDIGERSSGSRDMTRGDLGFAGGGKVPLLRPNPGGSVTPRLSGESFEQSRKPDPGYRVGKTKELTGQPNWPAEGEDEGAYRKGGKVKGAAGCYSTGGKVLSCKKF